MIELKKMKLQHIEGGSWGRLVFIAEVLIYHTTKKDIVEHVSDGMQKASDNYSNIYLAGGNPFGHR